MIKSIIACVIERYTVAAGIKPIQAKGPCHSHASYLINEFNLSVLILSKRLEHSSLEIMLKHYSIHTCSGADESIAEKMIGNIPIEILNEYKIYFQGLQLFFYFLWLFVKSC